MRSQWVIWLAVAGFAYVYGNPCSTKDTKDARGCYEDLVHYETLVFPLYGSNEAKLDDNCGNINMSLYCIKSYAENCLDNDECDDNCAKLMQDIHTFVRVSGLITFAENLCSKESVLRQTYLDNVECLENNVDLYEACHNDSQESQHYMHTVEGANTIEASCCYMSWYRDCFTNITAENCGANATVFVSIGVHNLLGYIADELCSSVPVSCDKPPLPPEGTFVGDDTEKDDGHDTEKDDGDNTEKDHSDDHDLDKDKPDKTDNEIDNTVDNHTGSSANTIKLHATIVTVLPYVFISLFRYLL